MAAMAWCDGYTAPLLVPLNGWLLPPLPLQIRAITCPQGVKLIEAAPSGQHVVVVPPQGDAQLWHVMSGQLVHIFKGRKKQMCASLQVDGFFTGLLQFLYSDLTVLATPLLLTIINRD